MNRAGQKIKNYILVNLLAESLHAEVYLAEDVNTKSQVAIKLLKLKASHLNYSAGEFLSEVRFMAHLGHPHIIKILDYGVNESSHSDIDDLFLVMEYAPLGSLRRIYSRGTTLPVDKLISYTKQIAQALQYAHNQFPSIVHRDIKPENILLRSADDVVLSDFGIALAGFNSDNMGEQNETILQAMKYDNNIFVPGTASYIAPERLEGKTQRASDQYSLAVIVYEYLTGTRPFLGNNEEVCYQHMYASPPLFHDSFPNIPLTIERIIMKGLSKRPEDRFSSIEAFANALEKAFIEAEPKTSKKSLPTHHR